MLKSIFYGAGLMLAGLWLVLMPHQPAAAAQSAAPTIATYQPSQVAEQNWIGTYLTVTGNNFPQTQNGLVVMVRPTAGGNYTVLETLSYIPQDGKIVAQIPYTTPLSDHYDLQIMTQNGASSVLSNAIAITEQTLTEEPVGGDSDDTPSPSTPNNPARPSVSFIKSSDWAPTVSTYTPALIEAGNIGGATITIEGPGTGWPGKMYGLAVNLVDTNTGQTIPTFTFSYTPQPSPLLSRLIVETPPLQPTVSTAYDIVVIAWNGHQTVIKNGLWYQKV